MTYEPTTADYEWLVSPAAEGWLQSAREAADPIPARVVEKFRRQLTPVQTSLVLHQTLFRRRAQTRFHAAEKMFFTDKGLQQATDDRIASYKADELRARARGDATGCDLCCGIGGDLTQLAQHMHVVGYDLDPIAVTLSSANLTALGASRGRVETADARKVNLDRFDWWHIDPDRRATGHRTSRVIYSQPNEQELDDLLKTNENGSLKLAPAAQLPRQWEAAAELEWIGHNRQCQQLWARFGSLARAHGQRTATTLNKQGQVLHTFSGAANVELCAAESIGRYLCEPHPSIVAARLTTALATHLNVRPVRTGIAYLTGESLVAQAGVEWFAVTDVLPYDFKRLKAVLRRRSIGRIEIKKRGVDLEPAKLRKRLRLTGDDAATVLIFPHGGKTMAVIAQRA